MRTHERFQLPSGRRLHLIVNILCMNAQPGKCRFADMQQHHLRLSELLKAPRLAHSLQ